MGLGEMETLRIAQFGEPVDDRAAGIAQAHHLGAFVEGLPDGVVDGLAEDLELKRAVDPDDLGIAAGNQQAEVREGRLPVLGAFLLDEIGEDMALQMVDHDDRFVQRDAERLGEGRADQQGSQQAGTAGESDRRQISRSDAGLGESLADNRYNVRFMGTGSQFGHDAPEVLVHLLARDHVRQQKTVADDGSRGVIA